MGEKSGYPVYHVNPSLVAREDIAKTRRKPVDERRGVLLDGENGGLLGPGVATIYEFEEVDKERFVKLYLAGLKQAIGMSKAGMVVFEYVYDQLRDKKEQDTVMLSIAGSGLEKSTFSRGMRELLAREFLYRSPYAGVFWVNIRYMFNGDRLAFIKGYTLKGRGNRAAPPDQLGLFNDASAVAAEMESEEGD